MRALIAAAALAAMPAAAYAAGGMPQLDFTNALTLSQAVWLLVIFAVLYVVVARVVLPPVGEVLDRRAAVIRTDLDAAKGASEAAKAARAELGRAEAKARAEAQVSVRAAVDAAKAKAEAAMASVESRLGADLRSAEARIAAARAAAMREIGGVAGAAAIAAVERVAGFTPEAGAVAGAIAERLGGRG